MFYFAAKVSFNGGGDVDGLCPTNSKQAISFSLSVSLPNRTLLSWRMAFMRVHSSVLYEYFIRISRTTPIAPDPVRSVKRSGVGPRENPRCCPFLSFFIFIKWFCPGANQKLKPVYTRRYFCNYHCWIPDNFSRCERVVRTDQFFIDRSRVCIILHTSHLLFVSSVKTKKNHRQASALLFPQFFRRTTTGCHYHTWHEIPSPLDWFWRLVVTPPQDKGEDDDQCWQRWRWEDHVESHYYYSEKYRGTIFFVEEGNSNCK